MASLTTPTTDRDAARREALAERLFGSFVAAGELVCIQLGDRLGLYRALAEHGPLDAEGLAAAAGIHPRYAREWLEQQAVFGVLELEDDCFRLPPGHAEALADRDSVAYSPPLGRLISAAAARVPELVDAFRSGGGVPWSAYGADAREGLAELNRTQFLAFLGTEWVPAMPDVHAALSRPGARIADVGCGAGWSSIALARAYPGARVDGFDVDEASIDLARAHAAAEGVADRVGFHLRDLADADPPAGGYDFACALECIHDMARPVEVLRAMRALLAPGGTVLVMDERAGDELTVGDPVEQLLYVASVLLCLPNGMAEEHSAMTGTVMRPETFRRYAQGAGFASVEVLDVEHPTWRFYRLG